MEMEGLPTARHSQAAQGGNLSMLIDVSYCGTDSEGFPMPPHIFSINASCFKPLLESIRGGLPAQLKKIRPTWMESSGEIECYEGHNKGQEVKLNLSPVDVPYLYKAMRTEVTPVLFLTDSKDSIYFRKDSGQGMSVSSRRSIVLSRSSNASGMVLMSQDRHSTHAKGESIFYIHPSEYRSNSFENNKPPRQTPSNLGLQHEHETGSMAVITPSPIEERKPFPRLPKLKGILEKSGTMAVMPPCSPVDEFKPLPSISADVRKVKSSTLQPWDTLFKGKEKQKPSDLNLTASMDSARNPRNPGGTLRSSMSTITMVPSSVPYHSKSQSFQFNTPLDSGKIFERKNAIKRQSSAFIAPPLLGSQNVKVSTESGEWSVILVSTAQLTVGEFRAAVSEHLRNHWIAQGSNSKQFILTYEVEGTTYELAKNAQFLQDSYCCSSCTDPEILPNFTVKYVSSPCQRDMRNLFRIARLICVVLDKRILTGGDLGTHTLVASLDYSEVALARRTLHEFVATVTEERDACMYSTSPEMIFSNTSISFSLKIPISNHITIVFHYKDLFSFRKSVHINTLANKLLEEIFPCIEACDLVQDSIDNYVLQVTGEDSYIHGDFRLIYFKDIRNFICKSEIIHLSVVKKPHVGQYQALSLESLKLDPHTSSEKFPSYYKIQSLKNPKCQASWDIRNKFRVKVCRVDNLGLKLNKVHVEVSLHFGCHPLHSPLCTKVKSQISFTATWDQELEFDLSIRDIPREAKLLVIVTDSSGSLLHWGLLTVFDHEGKLRCGDQSLHLWEENADQDLSRTRKSSEISYMFGPILAGPATNNTDSTAVKVFLSLPDLKAFHLNTKKNRHAFLKSGGITRNEQLRKHFEVYRIFKFVTPDSKKMPYSDLPDHLNVMWNKLEDRLEVHELLDDIREAQLEIPIHVALRLLDSDFPDSNVREFATSILELLSDDDLFDYLLQLTQALKFEILHDSPLARFLLRRALNSKKIGHFFFWYLHCELQCPQYAPRLAVILESYLIGCGEAMLTRFKDQLEVQDVLENISKQLKEKYDKDGVAMQAALPSALNTTDIDKRAFVPITNPRLMLGMMRSEKCKIMSSAKHPMWLEMLNMSRSAISPTPVRLILKMGDDLRQDMITLRMLALFDKLWKNEGLDLKLIPYSCIATSHKSGFIEVVKNAKTIAEVSGVRENKRLYQWIKNNQRDDYGEVDPVKLDTAIQTFIHSCAGYSVATYTLGIGDRHNDNIMINTSGNLFHIDFGHFLGNIKYYMGFKREWAPFVLTPDFVYAMGGENSKTFEYYRHLCCRAFMILRKNADLIINLFSMMRWTGIPELTCVDDMDYVRTALVLGMSETEAERCFRNVIKKCIDLGWTVQIMWALHKLKHSRTS